MTKGVKAAGAAIWVGIGKGDELTAIIEMSAVTIKLSNPTAIRT
jgi:hypothetical protein